MRIVVNAQIDPQQTGGIAQVLLGLVHSLGKLDGPEEYVFVCSPESQCWLAPHLGRNSRIETNTARSPAPVRGVRESDGFWESFSPDVLHFPYQSYTKTDVPSVFNPHDLQHVHLPHLFTDDERARREALYAQACRSATAVATTSAFVKDDVVRQYGVSSDQVHVIWWGAPSSVIGRASAADVARVLLKYALPKRFVIYPAQTGPHNNHKRLLEAFHALRARHNVDLSLVCTGAQTEHYTQLKELATKRGLLDRVRFLGWIDASDLMALYQAAEIMVVPTLFEAMSFPIFEAFDVGIPVACSAVTSLPEQVGDAAVLFDPEDVGELTSALYQLYEDADLRQALVKRGRERLKAFSWQRTAEQYRRLYRLAAGRLEQAECPVDLALDTQRR